MHYISSHLAREHNFIPLKTSHMYGFISNTIVINIMTCMHFYIVQMIYYHDFIPLKVGHMYGF